MDAFTAAAQPWSSAVRRNPTLLASWRPESCTMCAADSCICASRGERRFACIVGPALGGSVAIGGSVARNANFRLWDLRAPLLTTTERCAQQWPRPATWETRGHFGVLHLANIVPRIQVALALPRRSLIVPGVGLQCSPFLSLAVFSFPSIEVNLFNDTDYSVRITPLAVIFYTINNHSKRPLRPVPCLDAADPHWGPPRRLIGTKGNHCERALVTKDLSPIQWSYHPLREAPLCE